MEIDGMRGKKREGVKGGREKWCKEENIIDKEIDSELKMSE